MIGGKEPSKKDNCENGVEPNNSREEIIEVIRKSWIQGQKDYHQGKKTKPEKDIAIKKCITIWFLLGKSERIMYKPKPIDTNDIVLSKELLKLTEKIAEHVHDVWATGRIQEGWTYDLKKDGDAKTTPLLVPYNELPDEEKEYDRKTALETLKLIIKFGYKIERM